MRAGHVAGKTYTVDAIAAARAVISGQATTAPEAHDGAGEALWALQIVHRSSMKSRTQAPNQLHALVVTAPESIRAQLRRWRGPQLLVEMSGLPSRHQRRLGLRDAALT